MKNKPADRSSLGFTLVEMLVTITIIGVLAALSILVTTKIRSSAQNAKCVGNLRQLATAGQAYAVENGKFPCQGPQSGGWNDYWFRQLAPNLGFEDENNPAVIERSLLFPACEACLKSIKSPTNPQNKHIRTYSMNQELLTAITNKDGTTFSGIQAALIADPVRTSFFMDGTLVENSPYWDYIARSNEWMKPANFVHGDKANIVFIDGHVEARSIAEVPNKASDPFWRPKAN